MIRGYAVLLVMAFHFNVPGMNAAGRTGVTLFLVLSGYLICSHLLPRLSGSPASLIPYMRRRALRIGPALFVMLAVVSLAATAAGSFTEIGPAVLAATLMVANAPSPLGIDLMWLSHTWSLSLEWQFYVILPALLLVALSGRLVAGAVVVATVGAVIVYPEASGLAFGCLLAIGAKHMVGRVWGPVLVAAGSALLLVSAAIDNQSGYYHLVPAWIGSAGAFLIVGAALASSRRGGWMARLGTVSYSLYLWHMPIGTAAFAATYAAGMPWFVGAFGAAIISVAAATASYRYVERPFLGQDATIVPDSIRRWVMRLVGWLGSDRRATAT